jgi:RNA polymerase sigma-70 factor (ECF subfamily)
VVLPHLDDALSLARWLTGNISDAEDVVQDACIRAFGAIGTVKGGNPRAWLLAIVRNTAFTWLAKNRPKAVVVTDDDRLFEQAGLDMVDASSSQSPEGMLIAKADTDLLQNAIAALPVAYREVLVLREIEEMSYREISDIMSIPAGTVMSRLARARALLVQRIGMSVTGKAGAA